MHVCRSLGGVSCFSEQADYRIMAHYLPPLHKALLQMHILVQLPFGPQHNNHVPCDIIEPTTNSAAAATMIYLSHFFILFNYHLHYVYYKCKKKEEVNSNLQFPS